jgi:hypothetical protein
MNLELSDEQAAALIRELDRIIRGDRYPLSPRIMTLKAIFGETTTRTDPGTVTPDQTL